MARPVRPEPKFFLDDAYREIGLAGYEATFFDSDSDCLVRGEKSTSYIESELAAQRIHEFYPDAKILFLLREPLARAISNYRFSAENGLEGLQMAEALEAEAGRRQDYDPSQVSTSPFAYLQRGHYIEYLEMYERVFPRESLHVMLHEDLIGGPRTIAELYAFLGVADDFAPPNVDAVINATSGLPGELDADHEGRLRASFQASNDRLAERFGLDLSVW